MVATGESALVLGLVKRMFLAVLWLLPISLACGRCQAQVYSGKHMGSA
jgi:hypothetical protein